MKNLYSLLLMATVLGSLLGFKPAVVRSADADAETTAERLVQAIERIQSYDVALTYFLWALNDEGSLSAGDGLKVHDIFANGRGRRLECVNGEGTSISVIDWGSVLARKRGSVAIGLSYGDGRDYYKYYNPNCRGLLLTELAEHGATRRTLLPTEDRDGLICLQLENEAILKPHGPIKVWIDPTRGNMASVVETCIRQKGAAVPMKRLQIEEFFQVDKDLWVPVKGTEYTLQLAGPNQGKESLGCQIVVDIANSSWNQPIEPRQFTAASLPAMNFENPSGWKEQLTQSQLAGAVNTLEARRQVRSQAPAADGTSRPWLLAVNALIIALLAAMLLYYTYHKRNLAKHN